MYPIIHLFIDFGINILYNYNSGLACWYMFNLTNETILNSKFEPIEWWMMYVHYTSWILIFLLIIITDWRILHINQ